MEFEHHTVANREKYLARLEEIKKLPETAPGVYLHLGCGKEVFPGFLNIDKYFDHPTVINVSMDDPGLTRESVHGVYSSHSLEHLPYRRAIKALQTWYGLLRSGGRLYLAIPDLEGIMSCMLDPGRTWGQKWNWFIYQIYGYQVDPHTYGPDNLKLDLPEDPGQFHQCGFTEESIVRFLTDSGFAIDYVLKYDGWAAPCLWVEAIKP